MANLQSIAMLAELDGVLPVDKPLGISAHDVMREIKRRFNLVKVGHGGTLPPNATGVFPVLLGAATRVANDMMAFDSGWEGTMRLGTVTSTYDREGAVLERNPFDGVGRDALERAAGDFQGDVFLPEPAYSAVKLPGRDGYEIAGPDPAAERPPRLSHVYRLRLTSFEPPIVGFDLVSGKGVPVRTLVHELGRAAGCGASVETLRRVRFGAIAAADTVTFAKLLTSPPSVLLERTLRVPDVFGR